MILVLKQLTDRTASIDVLEAVGTVTADDYRRVFAPLVEQARTSGRRIRLLYQFGPDFARITPGALWADTRLGLTYAQLLEGCAVVSDIGWIATPARASASTCPVRSGYTRTGSATLRSLGSHHFRSALLCRSAR
ncbi:STAS/SEC14 domain-containing protein [Mycobacterium sp. SMC-14]|uniref:STAS/SEC14 domain-containing protein n=1 Tax=Mycobacterium sp. SMC-14 TaxID=3385968 RepID=UPI00390C878E